MSVKSADAAVREAEAQLQGIDVLVNSIASNVVPELLARKVATMADLGVPDAHDQAQLVVFLAGPQAARLTGQAISLNGGVSAA